MRGCAGFWPWLTGGSPISRVALIIKRRAAAAPSLRAGYATAAAAAGVQERKDRERDPSQATSLCLRRYIRSATAFYDVGEVL